jgi:hypothetical protein
MPDLGEPHADCFADSSHAAGNDRYFLCHVQSSTLIRIFP